MKLTNIFKKRKSSAEPAKEQAQAQAIHTPTPQPLTPPQLPWEIRRLILTHLFSPPSVCSTTQTLQGHIYYIETVVYENFQIPGPIHEDIDRVLRHRTVPMLRDEAETFRLIAEGWLAPCPCRHVQDRSYRVLDARWEAFGKRDLLVCEARRLEGLLDGDGEGKRREGGVLDSVVAQE